MQRGSVNHQTTSTKSADHDVNIPFRLYAHWYATEYPYARCDHTATEVKI